MTKLDSKTISIFCKNLSMMLEAGISTDEGIALLLEDVEEKKEDLYGVCLREINKEIYNGESFASAVDKCGLFPSYAVNMIKTGEESGRLEKVMESLSGYYDRRDNMTAELKTALLYPMILLLLMCGVLLIMVIFVLPVFSDVYENLSGSLASQSYAYINAARIIGNVSVILTIIICAAVLAALILWRSRRGHKLLENFFERAPVLRKISFKLAVSQFTDVLSTLFSSGIQEDSAMEEAVPIVSHSLLAQKLKAAYSEMTEGSDLSQALAHMNIYEPLYARMMISATRSGNLELNLHELAVKTEQDAESELRKLISLVEPVLTGTLTIVVGVTLLSIMLPLIGILGAV